MKIKSFILGFLVVSYLHAQDGIPDTSFGENGHLEIVLSEEDDYPHQVIGMYSGKILVSGRSYGGLQSFILGLNDDGSFDTGFADAGILQFTYQGGSPVISRMFLLPDDSFIVVFNSSGLKLAKYHATGDLDTDYGTGGYVSITTAGSSFVGIFESDGKLTVGSYSSNSGILNVYLHRFQEDGTLDSTFGDTGSVEHSISLSLYNISIIEGMDGKFTFCGIHKEANLYSLFLMRIHENGEMDLSFGEEGAILNLYEEFGNGQDIMIHSNLVQLTNGVYMAAFTEVDYEQEISRFYFVRFWYDGSRDMSYGNNGKKYGGPQIVNTFFLQPNNRMFVFGGPYEFEGGSYILRRYYSNGNADPSFQCMLDSSDLMGVNFVLQKDGKGLILSHPLWYITPKYIVLQRFMNNPLEMEEYLVGRCVVYPNPSTGIVYIDNKNFDGQPVAYSLYDFTGKTILIGEFYSEKSQLDISNYSSGIYLLSIENELVRIVKN